MKKLRKNSRIESLSPILVFWFDPATNRAGWRKLSQVRENMANTTPGRICITVGLFVYKDDKQIGVALSATNDDWQTEADVTDVFEIPLGTVESIFLLE